VQNQKQKTESPRVNEKPEQCSDCESWLLPAVASASADCRSMVLAKWLERMRGLLIYAHLLLVRANAGSAGDILIVH
jgi:hypothetical protein